MTADLHRFLQTRRSIRRFRPDPLPEEVLGRILETATYAPSAHNLQPWRFAVVATPETKSRLAEAITGQFRAEMTADGVPEADITSRVERSTRRLNEAPVAVVLCRDVSAVKPQPDAAREQAEATMAIQSVALAGGQLLLAAHAEGLGGTWICWPLFTPEATRLALDLPAEWEPQGMVFLGYPAEEPEEPERRALQEITRFM
jgi:coenzyme F420-0:L-glutamate ligase/coenzyme F420-1:gamma-L-glutamate ligase